jgi:hypothetical protein
MTDRDDTREALEATETKLTVARENVGRVGRKHVELLERRAVALRRELSRNDYLRTSR